MREDIKKINNRKMFSFQLKIQKIYIRHGGRITIGILRKAKYYRIFTLYISIIWLFYVLKIIF